jgi:hypothetical protein
MTIAEPSTLLTDYLLALTCAWFAWRLLARPPGTRLLWGLGFACLAVASAVGGTFHGFRPVMGPGTAAWFWNVTLVGIGAGAGFILSALLAQRSGVSLRLLRWAGGITGAALLLLAARVGLHPRFNHNDLYHCLQWIALVILYRSIPGRPHTGDTNASALGPEEEEEHQ